MAGAQVTLEGWYVLHAMYGVDWPRWNTASDAERDAAVTEAAALLARQESPGEGHSACFSLLTQKGDLLLIHWRPDLEALRSAQVALDGTRLRTWLVPTYSYLSVVELGTYELGAHATAILERRGLKPDAPGWDEALRAELERLARPRLYPEVPPRRYVSFYPMSKRRGETVNWYDLPPEERAALMRG